MNNFRFYAPTDIRFGKGQADCLPEELGKYGKRILMVYGGGSVKRSGLYDKLRELLKDFEIFELPGIEPNPKDYFCEKGRRDLQKGADRCHTGGGRRQLHRRLQKHCLRSIL